MIIIDKQKFKNFKNVVINIILLVLGPRRGLHLEGGTDLFGGDMNMKD